MIRSQSLMASRAPGSGKTMIGSALVMEFSDRELLDQYLAEEPYVVEGVWEKIDVLPMNVVLLDGRKVGK